MEYRYNINKILPEKINKITHTLIPEGFRGDRREYNECQRLLTRILDDIGEASAKAQRLNRTITSAVKLRDTDHIIYLMMDQEANNGLGSVVGLLKTGSKSLFMFDENGYHYQLKPRCILDFYIHESRQRKGLGLQLYQHMLADENISPIKLAIDRPSDKFMAFLMKHYGFSSVIPQNNKFVVFRGFFDDEVQYSDTQFNNKFSNMSINRQQIIYQPHCEESSIVAKNNDLKKKPTTHSAYGRYAASRPPCSMANIIHNTAIKEPQKNSRVSTSAANKKFKERPDSLSLFEEDKPETTINEDLQSGNFNEEKNKFPQQDSKVNIEVNNCVNDTNAEIDNSESFDVQDKNLSQKIEIVDVPNFEMISMTEIEGQRPGIGHLDLKFYHSPLW